MGTHFSSIHSLCLILAPCLHHMTFEEKNYFAYLLKTVIFLPNCNFHVASKITKSQRCRKLPNMNLDSIIGMHDQFWFLDYIYTQVIIKLSFAQTTTKQKFSKAVKDSEVLKPCQRCIQSQVGPISSSSRPLSPQQKAWWGRTKADPSGNSYKKHPKNTQQALARSLHLPSLKLTAKESPGGRKFGLCPTCKCAVWGAVRGRKSHKQALWIQRKTTQTPSNSEPL